MIKNGSGFQPRQFEKNTVHPNNMQNLGLRELTERRGSKKQRARRSLRIMLPAWLSGMTVKDSEQTEKDMK